MYYSVTHSLTYLLIRSSNKTGGKKRNTDSEENEEFLIALTDAVIDPWTVMVHLPYTALTHTAPMKHNTTLNN